MSSELLKKLVLKVTNKRSATLSCTELSRIEYNQIDTAARNQNIRPGFTSRTMTEPSVYELELEGPKKIMGRILLAIAKF